jgi:hypothetical protein
MKAKLLSLTQRLPIQTPTGENTIMPKKVVRNDSTANMVRMENNSREVIQSNSNREQENIQPFKWRAVKLSSYTLTANHSHRYLHLYTGLEIHPWSYKMIHQRAKNEVHRHEQFVWDKLFDGVRGEN